MDLVPWLSRPPIEDRLLALTWPHVVGVKAQAFAYPAGVSALVYAFYVPLLVVTHVVMFYWLFSHWRSA
jgi:hypothetical protein